MFLCLNFLFPLISTILSITLNPYQALMIEIYLMIGMTFGYDNDDDTYAFMLFWDTFHPINKFTNQMILDYVLNNLHYICITQRSTSYMKIFFVIDVRKWGELGLSLAFPSMFTRIIEGLGHFREIHLLFLKILFL